MAVAVSSAAEPAPATDQTMLSSRPDDLTIRRPRARFDLSSDQEAGPRRSRNGISDLPDRTRSRSIRGTVIIMGWFIGVTLVRISAGRIEQNPQQPHLQGRKTDYKMTQGRILVGDLTQQRKHACGSVLLPRSGRVVHPYPPNAYPFDVSLGDETAKRGGYCAVSESPAQVLLDGAGAHGRSSNPQHRENSSFEFARLSADHRTGRGLRLIGLPGIVLRPAGIVVASWRPWVTSSQQGSSSQARMTGSDRP